MTCVGKKLFAIVMAAIVPKITIVKERVVNAVWYLPLPVLVIRTPDEDTLADSDN